MNTWTKPLQVSFYLLSGILVCSCGKAMVGRSAKSHRYYYYTCNRSCKQGREACDSRILPKEKIERLMVDKDRVKLYYNLPVPLDGKKMETVGVLPIDNLGENFMQLIRAVGIYHPNYKLLTQSTGGVVLGRALVEPGGFEPPTFAMQTRRSPK